MLIKNIRRVLYDNGIKEEFDNLETTDVLKSPKN